MLLGAPGGPWVDFLSILDRFWVHFGWIRGPFWTLLGAILGEICFFLFGIAVSSSFVRFCLLPLSPCSVGCICVLLRAVVHSSKHKQPQATMSKKTQAYLPQASTSNHKALQATTDNKKQQQLPQETTSNHKQPQATTSNHKQPQASIHSRFPFLASQVVSSK